MRLAPVLMICEDYMPDTGGLAAAAARISRQLARERPVTVVTFLRMDPDKPFKFQATSPHQNLTIYRVGPFTKGWAEGRDWRGYTERVMKQMEDWIQSQHLLPSGGIVVGFGIKSAGVLARRLLRRENGVLIQCVRGNDLSRSLFDIHRCPDIIASVTLANVIVAVNSQLAALLQTAFPALKSRIQILPNSVSAAFLTESRKLPSLPKRQKAVYPMGYVGTMREQKNPGVIFHLMEKILQPEGAPFRIVGSIDNTLRHQCGYSELDAANRTFVTSRAMDAAGLAQSIAELSLGVFPSIVEGLSNALLETAACGVPIIGTVAAADLLSLVDDRLICSPFQPNEFSELASELLESFSMRQELGEKLRRVVESEFSPEAEFYRWTRLLSRFDA